MLSELVLVHRTLPAPSLSAIGGGDLVWRTCLREIRLAFQDSAAEIAVAPSDEVYSGADAYRFLLEILCGLHSRILGENEIVGQFKKRFLEEALPEAYADDFRRLAQALLTDMKQVRRQYPLNLGAHSYGSFCRRELEGASPVAILGTGELAVAIAPWFSKKTEVRVLHRSEESRARFERKLSQANSGVARTLVYRAIDANPLDLSGALVIAAPLSAREIDALIARASVHPTKVIDLRGDSAEDPILPITLPDGSEATVLDLQDFFRDAESANRTASGLKAAALARVARLTDARLDSESIVIRTYGWEDLCG
jgi:glutamyl-tRNA reductase